MADINVTSVTFVSGTIGGGTAGESISVGDLIYLKSSDGKYYLAEADNTLQEATVRGMSLDDGISADETFVFIRQGEVTVNAVLVDNTRYFLSSTAGQLASAIPGTSGRYIHYMGTAGSTTQLLFFPHNSGVTN